MQNRFNTSKTTGTSKNIVQRITEVRTRHWVRQLFGALAVFMGVGVVLSACASKPAPEKGTLEYVQGFLGGVVADEPRAALVGRAILARGGSAADAATAMYFALAVTLPSRAGLGGGGTCVSFDAKSGNTEALDFTSLAPTPNSATSQPSIAIPANPRGFFALQARYGRLLWREVVAPSEQLARFGFPTSRALAQDLRAMGPSILKDPDMRTMFARTFTRTSNPQQGTMLVREGDILKEPDLATTLDLIRARGVGPFYIGTFAHTLVSDVKSMGGSMTSKALRQYIPHLRSGVRVEVGNNIAIFAPSPTGAAVAGEMFAMVQKNDRFIEQNDAGRTRIMEQISQRALAAQHIARTPSSAQKARSSTAFAAVDQQGNAVSCAVSMNAPFGTRRVAQGTGILLAAAPSAGSSRAINLAPMLMVNENSRTFKFAAAAAGGMAAPRALVSVAARVLLAKESLKTALAAPRGKGENALVNALSCPGGLPGRPDTCQIATDPRGVGLAVGSLP